MAQSLPTLIKLVRHKVEAKQQQVAQVEQGISALQQKKEMLAEQVRNGHAAAIQQGEALLLEQAGRFATRAESEHKQMDFEIDVLSQAQEKLVSELRALFAEQKRYEILQESQTAKTRKEQAKKSQNQLDDLANTRQVRRP